MDIITYALLNKKIKNKLSFSFQGFKKVSELPIKGESNYIYLLPSGENNYAEYIWIDNRWELLGDINKSNLDYNDLLNKPKINNVELTGNKTTIELGINIPTKVSDLNNDSKYQTADQIEQTLTQKNYSTKTELQGKLSIQQGSENVGKIPTVGVDGNLKLETISSGGGTTDYNLLGNKPKINGIELNGDKNSKDLDLVSFVAQAEEPLDKTKFWIDTNDNTKNKAIPTKVSQLTNDLNFQTDKQVEQSIISKGYQTSQDVENILNGKKYLTSIPQASDIIVGGVKVDKFDSSFTEPVSINEQGKLVVKKQSGGTSNYADLTNKPSINGHELNGNQTAEQLGLQPKGNYLIQHQDISGKADKTEIPTKTSQLTNDSGYLTEHQSLVGYVKTSELPKNVSELANDSNYQNDKQVQNTVNQAIKGVTQFEYEKVSVLPLTGVKGKIYLVASAETADKNIYDEYIWVDTAFELIGTTKIDLSGYVTDVQLEEKLKTKLNTTDISEWAKAPTKPTYTAKEVGALPEGTVIPEFPKGGTKGQFLISNGDGTTSWFTVKNGNEVKY